MSKQLSCQKFIYKIHSSRLRKEKWKLSLPISEARKNEEVISLADSQILRWIDELNGVVDGDAVARRIKREIAQIRREPYSVDNRRRMRKLYADLDNVQFKPDYMCLIIDKEKDYHRACRGFTINDVRYVRLLGTNGGIKNSTIVFVSERLAPELRRRIENGRNPYKELVTAKLEAYKALTCSASNPVSMPNGILVVSDVETTFKDDIVYLSNEDGGEPKMEYIKDYEVRLDACDGCGIMLPSLAKRWSKELGLDYVASGVNTRFCWEKGMVYTFDYLDFANKVGGKYIVKDAWGNDVDVRFTELILTTSMVKLWDSYDSCADYVENCIDNHYTFGIAKVCPKELENEHTTNYQFIQPQLLDENDIDELIAPTMNEITDVLGGDWRKTLLFLRGEHLTDAGMRNAANDYIKAISINPKMMEDPYVRSGIYQLIKGRINEAKVGVLKVHGNYSIVSGDPYLLCEHVFGLEPHGLLKAGEIFNKYWADAGSDAVLCFRAPMSCANNIRKLTPVRSKEAMYWYKYMPTATILNGFDTTCAALNGMDFDGDLVFLTDNDVMLRKYVHHPTLVCAQRRAEKCIPTEEDFIRTNINSFGNDIGQITNRVTSMYDVRVKFEPDSEEYKVLSYRIQSGQQYQQDEIDKSKGIISHPMPRNWYDRHQVYKIEDEEKRNLYRATVADKKPYFMRYIYPDLMQQYNTYIKNTDRKSLREFGMKVAELKAIPKEELTERQAEFIHYYDLRMPVSVNNSVMNVICRKFEQKFDHLLSQQSNVHKFDYSFMKSGQTYTLRRYGDVERLYKEYSHRLQKYAMAARRDRIDRPSMNATINSLHDEFRAECDSVCPNAAELCDMLLDLCYRKSTTKRFVWALCGDEIIANLLNNNNNTISYPVEDKDGDVYYNGKWFAVRTIDGTLIEETEKEVDDDDCDE